jgi:serine/threonine protein phosphatase PrpC
MTSDTIYCANAGDSRAILAFKDSTEILELSFDHKPKDEKEKERVISAGGFIENNRLNG